MEDNSPFCSASIVLKMALHPSCYDAPINAIKNQLNNMLFAYNEELGGIPLSYSSINFPDGKCCGRILADQPWLHVQVQTKMIVFRPTIGAIIPGQIAKITDSHASLLVFAMFNASVSVDEIRKQYTFNYASNRWENNSGGFLQDGDEVQMRIESFHHAHGLININGSFVS